MRRYTAIEKGSAVVAMIVALLVFASACESTPQRAKGWKRTVFRPGGYDVVVPWRTLIYERPVWDYKPLEDGIAGVDERFVYVGGRSRTLFKIDRLNGNIANKREMNEEIFSKPVIVGDRVYFGTASGVLHAMDKNTLKDIWSYTAKSELLAAPVVSGDTIFLVSQNEVLTAINAEDGAYLWEYSETYTGTMAIRRHARPVVFGDYVYQGFTNGAFSCIEKSSGRLIWRRNLGSGKRFDDVNTTPVVTESAIYVGSFDNGMYCLDRESGITIWKNPIISASSPMLIDGKLYFTATEEGFYCLNAKTGEIDWFMEFKALFMEHEEGALSELSLYKNEFLVFSASGTGLYFMDFRNKRLIARMTPGNGITSDPAVEGDFVYTLSNGGYVYASALAKAGSPYIRRMLRRR